MENTAFFFQGASLLLPKGASLEAINPEIPLSHAGGLAGDFSLLDTFTIPDIAFTGGHAGGPSPISCAVVAPDAPLPSWWQAIPVRQTLAVLPLNPDGSGTLARLLRAFHIAQWRQESLFCGSCGGKNGDAATGELARFCPACGRMEFPRISPAVILRITNNEGKILLAHNKRFASGLYSLIAGFVEAGETLEAAAIRETREETGIEIGNVRYLNSQPWPFPNSLTVGFSARYLAGDIKPDGIEIEDAQWFSRDSLPTLPGPGSMSRRLIEEWVETVSNEQ